MPCVTRNLRIFPTPGCMAAYPDLLPESFSTDKVLNPESAEGTACCNVRHKSAAVRFRGISSKSINLCCFQANKDETFFCCSTASNNLSILTLVPTSSEFMD